MLSVAVMLVSVSVSVVPTLLMVIVVFSVMNFVMVEVGRVWISVDVATPDVFVVVR